MILSPMKDKLVAGGGYPRRPDADDAAMSDPRLHTTARQLAAYLEPIVGSVYFAPECHERYAALGFAPSPGKAGGVAAPRRPRVLHEPRLLPRAGARRARRLGVRRVQPRTRSCRASPTAGRSPTRRRSRPPRTEGAVAQLERILGPEPDGLDRATEILRRATDPAAARRVARCTRACSSLGLPGTPMGDFWRLGDYLREFRGDSHTAAWVALGLDATEIGLLTELFIGLPMRTYIRTRAWSDDDLDAAVERLQSRDLIDADGTGFTDGGRELRESIEISTDLSMAPTIEAIGDDADELFALLGPWGAEGARGRAATSAAARPTWPAQRRDPGA